MPTPITTLVVDDAEFLRRMLIEVIEPVVIDGVALSGIENLQVVGIASNGEEAIEQFKKLRPWLVMMDIVLPKISGIEATAEIITIDPNATIIVCSALGQESLVMEALDAGARDFIVKPYNPDDVVETIRRVLSSER